MDLVWTVSMCLQGPMCGALLLFINPSFTDQALPEGEATQTGQT